MRLITAGLIVLIAAHRAEAQRLEPVGIRSLAAAPVAEASHAAEDRGGYRRVDEVVGRFVLGAAGSAVGLYTGASIAVAATGKCSGEYCTLERATLGSFAFSALASSAPRLGSSCGFPKRLALGLLGATLGGVAGTVLGAATDRLEGLLLGHVVGTAAGTATAQAFC